MTTPLLFCNVPVGEVFYFHDKPERRLVKLDERKYFDERKQVRTAHPYVLVFQNGSAQRTSIYETIGGNQWTT